MSLYFLSLINNSPSFITSTSNDHKNYYFVAFESLCRFKEIGHSIISFDRGIIMLPATHKYDGYKNINWLKCFISWQPQANQPFTNSSFDVYCQVFFATHRITNFWIGQIKHFSCSCFFKRCYPSLTKYSKCVLFVQFCIQYIMQDIMKEPS